MTESQTKPKPTRADLEKIAWDAMLKVTEAVAAHHQITPDFLEQANAALADVDRWWNYEAAA